MVFSKQVHKGQLFKQKEVADISYKVLPTIMKSGRKTVYLGNTE
jgi:hypothetical protein